MLRVQGTNHMFNWYCYPIKFWHECNLSKPDGRYLWFWRTSCQCSFFVLITSKFLSFFAYYSFPIPFLRLLVQSRETLILNTTLVGICIRISWLEALNFCFFSFPFAFSKVSWVFMGFTWKILCKACNSHTRPTFQCGKSVFSSDAYNVLISYICCTNFPSFITWNDKHKHISTWSGNWLLWKWLQYALCI